MTEQPTPKAKRYSRRPASPDDPIYTRGFVIGGWHSAGSLPTTPTPPQEPTGSSEPDPMQPVADGLERALEALAKGQSTAPHAKGAAASPATPTEPGSAAPKPDA